MPQLTQRRPYLGKGEVLSSILSGSTTLSPNKYRLLRRSPERSSCMNAHRTCKQQIPVSDTNLTPAIPFNPPRVVGNHIGDVTEMVILPTSAKDRLGLSP